LRLNGKVFNKIKKNKKFAMRIYNPLRVVGEVVEDFSGISAITELP
jgi:hypothetical protein